MRPDPFWLVLQESSEIGELLLHLGGQDGELLLKALRLETQLVVDPLEVSFAIPDGRQHRRRRPAVLHASDEVVEPPLDFGAVSLKTLTAAGALVERGGNPGAHGVRKIGHYARRRELSLERGE